MLPAQTLRHHQLKHSFIDNLVQLAERRINPSASSVRNLRCRWVKEQHGGFEDHSVLDVYIEYEAKKEDEFEIEMDVEKAQEVQTISGAVEFISACL